MRKSGALSDQEWRALKRHPEIGADITAPVGFLRSNGIVELVLHHHESYDGRGYPAGLAGDDIPLGARIIAVSDSLSAMMQDRPYRSRMTFQQALRDIARLSAVRYDPVVVKTLLKNAKHISQLMQGMLESETESGLSAPSKTNGMALFRSA